MKHSRHSRRWWHKLRWPLVVLVMIVIANVLFQQRWYVPSGTSRNHAERTTDKVGLSSPQASGSPPPGVNTAPNETGFEEGQDDTHPPPLADEVVMDLKRPIVRPKLSNVLMYEGVKGSIAYRVDGPEDAADERLLWELAPAIVPGSEGTVAIDIPHSVRKMHLVKHFPKGHSAKKAIANGTKLIQMANAVSQATDRVEKRFRFVQIIIAVRTQRLLDIADAVAQWQRNCDDPSVVPKGTGSGAQRPMVFCTFAVTLPNEYSNDTVAHYRGLLQHDDTVLVVHSSVALTKGVVALQKSGIAAANAHFADLLPKRHQQDYLLLTAVQFTPTSTSDFVARLVRQYEDSSDSLDPLSRRVAGGAVQRGPILGCTLVMDAAIGGSRYTYGSPHVVIEKGVEFLYGNGDGGSQLNSMYAVRRLAGIDGVDERVTGAFRHNASRVNQPFNVDLRPGVEPVHAISPYCALMSSWVYHTITSSDSLNAPQLDPDQNPSLIVTSMLESFEDDVGTGAHRSKLPNRTTILKWVPLRTQDTEHDDLQALSTNTLQETIFMLSAMRLQTLDRIRSQIRFSDVMSGSAKFKRIVSYFIRFLDDASRFHESVTQSPFSQVPRATLLDRLPTLLRKVETLHEDIIQSHLMVEDKISAALLYASRAVHSLGRWFQQRKARRPSAADVAATLLEESVLWHMCLRSQSLHQIPSLVSNLSVRLLQHEYLAAAALRPLSAELFASPVHTAYLQGELIPVSTRLTGPFQTVWRQRLMDMKLHPSFAQSPRLQVVWYTHCCHCCGFSNELQSLVYPLQRFVNVHLTAGPDCFCSNASRTLYDTLDRLFSRPQNIQRYAADDVVVYISHTNPTLFHLSREVQNAKHDYFVGRSMYEFSRINAEHIALANKLADEIWVPAAFVYHSYLSSGANKEKLVIVPEAIDTHVFHPGTAGRIELPPKNLFHMCNRPATAANMNFTFLSDFKWEPRKGWDVLFEAYFRAFNHSDPVVLFVLTHIWFPGGPETYGWAHNITWIMQDLEAYMKAKTTLFQEGRVPSQWPTYCIISESMSVGQMAALYNSVDAFVYSTRGEGWGLPAMQAMSMALPVIATNFGGVTEFLKPFNSFLIPLDGVLEIPFDSVYGWSFGTKWAQPSVQHAAELMRYVSQNPQHARRVGAVARRYIVENFSEEALGEILNGHLQRIRSKVLSKRIDDDMKKRLSP